MRRLCSAPSPPPQQATPSPPRAPRVQTAGEDSVRAQRKRRRRGRRQLRVALNLGGLTGAGGLSESPGTSLTIGN